MNAPDRAPPRPWGGTLYLCGAGNSEGVRLALNVEARARRFRRIVLLDDDPATHDRVLLGVPVVGTFDLLDEADPDRDGLVNLVARTTTGRRRARERMAASGVPFAPLVAPGVDTLGAAFDDDVIVYPHATLGPETVLGPGSVVFMGAVVGHESRVGAGCVLASNAVLNARVVLEEGVYVGTNATVLPEVRIGADATVGAGSVAAADVPPGATVLGVPGRILVPGSGEAAPDRGAGRRSDPAADPDRNGNPNAREWEARVSAAWSEILDRTDLSPEVPVFDLGADSLAALRVAEVLRREGASSIQVVDVFRHPTIRGLARRLAAERANTVAARRVAPARAAEPLRSTLLPSPEQTTAIAAEPWELDEASLLREVVDAFSRALGRDDVGPDSHFFDLGGDTASAQVVCELLRVSLGEPICFMQVVRRPTPLEFAHHLAVSLGQPPECVAQGVLRRLVRRAVTHGG